MQTHKHTHINTTTFIFCELLWMLQETLQSYLLIILNKSSHMRYLQKDNSWIWTLV